MSIEIQCMTKKLIIITIKLDYSKEPGKSTVPTYDKKNFILFRYRFLNVVVKYYFGLKNRVFER